MIRILSIALVAILTMSADSFAEKPEGKQRPGQAGQRAGGPRGAAGQEGRDPQEMVTRMMETFDKDGDQKLDVAELTAMFTSMRERRGQGAAGRGGEAGQQGRRRGGEAGKPGAAGRPGAARKPGAAGQEKPGRRGKGENQGDAGGERPKRPAVE